MAEQGAELSTKFLKVAEEQIKIHVVPPEPATPNTVRLDLRTVVVRDYGKPGGIPTLVDAPYAGHTAIIADYAVGQSLVLGCHGVQKPRLEKAAPVPQRDGRRYCSDFISEPRRSPSSRAGRR